MRTREEQERIEMLLGELRSALQPKAEEIKVALEELLRWVPDQENWVEVFRYLSRRRGGGYTKGDETAPFFSEAFLYNLLGKEDARSLLGRMQTLLSLLGYDPVRALQELGF